MITSVIMKRDFNGSQVSQRTGDSFFNATELIEIWNRNNPDKTKELGDFWKSQNVKDFVSALEVDIILNTEKSPYLVSIQPEGVKVKSVAFESKKGRYGGTWMHPYLFVKLAMWISTQFELQIIKWVYDNLIQFRCDAGDYYKDMMASLKDHNERNKVSFSPMWYSHEATMLNMLVFSSPKAKQREEASEYELTLMNELQLYNIILLEEDVELSMRKKLLFNRTNSNKKIYDKIEAHKSKK